jgi:hypothetical protein
MILKCAKFWNQHFSGEASNYFLEEKFVKANQAHLHALQVYSVHFCWIAWFCNFIMWGFTGVQKGSTWDVLLFKIKSVAVFIDDL